MTTFNRSLRTGHSVLFMNTHEVQAWAIPFLYFTLFTRLIIAIPSQSPSVLNVLRALSEYVLILPSVLLTAGKLRMLASEDKRLQII